MPAPSTPDLPDYPGEAFGMPPQGPGSLARLGRRAAGFLADFALCVLITRTFFPLQDKATLAATLVPTAVLAAENIILVSTTGMSVGHLVAGLRVGQVRKGFFPLQVVVRTLLLCLLLPAIFTDRDGRGLHDAIAGTVVARR